MDRSAYEQYLEVEERHFWRVAKRRLVVGLVEELFGARRDLHVVDIGGACSLVVEDLRRFGLVESVEPDEETVELARSRLGIEVHHGSLPDGLPPLAPADVITMLDVIEHIEDDHEALVAVRDLLAPGGVLIVTVPALAWLWSEHDVVLHHHRRYVRSQLVSVLERAGFRIERASYYTSLLLPAVAAERLAKKLRPRPGPPRYDVSVPSRLVNDLLSGVMSLERRMLAAVDMPLGSSLFAVARLC